MHPIAKRRTLGTVEMARGIAAMLVVLFHANASADEFGGPMPHWPSFGEHGVDFFFVLSGFIIFVAHGDEIGSPDAARPYLLKRAIRLLPPLWIIVLGWALLRDIVGVDVDPLTVVRSVALLPSLEPTMPLVVWTLRHELLFYLMFVVLIAWPPGGRVMLGLWFLGAAVQFMLAVVGRPVTGLASFFLSSFSLDFAMGMGVAWLHRRYSFSESFLPLAIAVVLVACVLALGVQFHINRLTWNDYTSLPATVWTVVLGIAFAALLHGLLRIENQVTVPRWAMMLGAASYSIYLLHTIVNSLAQRMVLHLPEGFKAVGGGHVILIVAGTGAGIGFHYLLERPITYYLRRRLLSPPARPRPATSET